MLAREYNIHFFETSAKQDMNVEKSFITIATDVKERLMVDGGSSGATTGKSGQGQHYIMRSINNFSIIKSESRFDSLTRKIKYVVTVISISLLYFLPLCRRC